MSGLPQGTRQTARQQLVIDVLPHDRAEDSGFARQIARSHRLEPARRSALQGRVSVLPRNCERLLMVTLGSRPALSLASKLHASQLVEYNNEATNIGPIQWRSLRVSAEARYGVLLGVGYIRMSASLA